ncbi:MBL fold metallo-hydrolase [Paenibacillus mendelii]|uniref:MBL fold metallo-hydrolase n=1 Tax=Paenibacillus mendelii TaxID=206163 RepID=A0ABV6JJX2_9BACL|nr:MBL fold metallo-hydrolase [Paenibacillus mendelii]MCQ6558917.1 MBL fold metallo-hydrolase [Paenibacillus mendelii]
MATIRYENLDPAAKLKSFKEMRKWRQERASKMKSKDFTWSVPSGTPDIPFLHSNSNVPSVTWIGHSTFLIQHSGLNIVTDPVWAQQMGFQKRLTMPGIPIADMPPIDIVLISHSHYDHLHMGSLEALKGSKTLIVPVGLADKMRRKGFSSVVELSWWESANIGGVIFTFVPSQHWTRRTLLDMNRSHWGGYVIQTAAKRCGVPDGLHGQSSDKDSDKNSNGLPRSGANSVRDQNEIGAKSMPTVYFAGDSGYFDGFKAIGERFDIDIALMPIGAYEPEWFMGPQHVTPEEALRAFTDIGARRFVPMHYGSFRLADDTPREALDRLEAERLRLGIDEERMVVLPHGKTWKA